MSSDLTGWAEADTLICICYKWLGLGQNTKINVGTIYIYKLKTIHNTGNIGKKKVRKNEEWPIITYFYSNAFHYFGRSSRRLNIYKGEF